MIIFYSSNPFPSLPFPSKSELTNIPLMYSYVILPIVCICSLSMIGCKKYDFCDFQDACGGDSCFLINNYNKSSQSGPEIMYVKWNLCWRLWLIFLLFILSSEFPMRCLVFLYLQVYKLFWFFFSCFWCIWSLFSVRKCYWTSWQCCVKNLKLVNCSLVCISCGKKILALVVQLNIVVKIM